MMGGGMGGGLMGLLMKGGMGAPPGQSQAAGGDVYDVSRWQRSDGLDAAPTMVQSVRADWERKNEEQRERSVFKKLRRIFHRKQTEPVKAAEPESRPAGGTVVTPEMKKASQRIHPSGGRETPTPQAHPPQTSAERGGNREKNYLGLSFQTEIDGFFTMNPMNSALLAVDRLGMGALTLNQVVREPGPEPPDERTQATAPSEEPEAAPHGDVGYMGAFRANREQQKYQVRIRE
jgi:hypothetical protein